MREADGGGRRNDGSRPRSDNTRAIRGSQGVTLAANLRYNDVASARDNGGLNLPEKRSYISIRIMMNRLPYPLLLFWLSSSVGAFMLFLSLRPKLLRMPGAQRRKHLFLERMP